MLQPPQMHWPRVVARRLGDFLQRHPYAAYSYLPLIVNKTINNAMSKVLLTTFATDDILN